MQRFACEPIGAAFGCEQECSNVLTIQLEKAEPLSAFMIWVKTQSLMALRGRSTGTVVSLQLEAVNRKLCRADCRLQPSELAHHPVYVVAFVIFNELAVSDSTDCDSLN